MATGNERGSFLEIENKQNPKPKEHEIDCDDSCCGRLKLLLTPYHRIPNEGHKSFSTVFLPETYYLYALLYFWFFFGVCMVVTVAFSKEYHKGKDTNPVILRDGYNMICISWDYPPVTKFSVPLFLPFLFLVFIYAVFDLLRVYYAYTHDHFISRGQMITYKAAVIMEVICVLVMPETMAVPPEPVGTNFVLHTIPYLMLLLALWLLNATQIFYYVKIDIFAEYKRKGEKVFNGLLIFYGAVITFVILYNFTWTTVNLIGMVVPGAENLWLNKRFPVIKHFGKVVEIVFLATVAILPVPIKILIAPQLKDKFVLLSMTHDVAVKTK